VELDAGGGPDPLCEPIGQPCLAGARRTFQDQKTTHSKGRQHLHLIYRQEDGAVDLRPTPLPAGLGVSGQRGPVLVEEEVEEIAHQLCSAIVVHGDCSVDDMSIGSNSRADVRPLAGNDLRHVRAEIQQVGLHPQPTAVEAFECAKAACVSRPT
jgi:hypothetical protein